jgi:hypothetical protein
VWINKLLINPPSRISKLQHGPLPSKCCEPRIMPQFLTLSIFLIPFRSSNTPFYLEVLRAKERASIPYSINFPSPISELEHALLPRSVVSQGVCPNSLLFRCFHLRLTFESIKELGSASHEVLIFNHMSSPEHVIKDSLVIPIYGTPFVFISCIVVSKRWMHNNIDIVNNLSPLNHYCFKLVPRMYLVHACKNFSMFGFNEHKNFC